MEGRKPNGQFLPGYDGRRNVGRPKGARSKFNARFFDDYYVAWQEHGADALRRLALENPKDFVKVAAMVVPREVDLEVSGQIELLSKIESFSQAYHYCLEHIKGEDVPLLEAKDLATT